MTSRRTSVGQTSIARLLLVLLAFTVMVGCGQFGPLRLPAPEAQPVLPSTTKLSPVASKPSDTAS